MKTPSSTPHELLQDDDLSETQIFTTLKTYDRCAKEYARKWEWNKKTIEEIKKYNINPFVKYAQKGGTVLIIGSRSGRDYQLLSEKKFVCLGVEPAYGLLTEAVKRVPNGLFINLDIPSLPFIPESFSAIYADALTHIPKSRMREIIRDFSIFLKKKGVLYLSLKLGTVHVAVMKDLEGKRYVTLYRKQEITDAVESVGFMIRWSKVSLSTDPTLPKWFSLIAEKL